MDLMWVMVPPSVVAGSLGESLLALYSWAGALHILQLEEEAEGEISS
jgi:hypothetical protein